MQRRLVLLSECEGAKRKGAHGFAPYTVALLLYRNGGSREPRWCIAPNLNVRRGH